MTSVNDVVYKLVQTPFSGLCEEDKQEVLACGRPTPLIEVTVKKEVKWMGKSYNKQFKTSWYTEYEWLCGSHHLQRLFCWPCLLFGSKKHVWNMTGFNDFLNVNRGLHKHEDSAEHLKSTLQLKALERNRNVIADVPKENAAVHIAQFNENVRMNRIFMHTVVDAVLFLNQQELAFPGHGGSAASVSHGHFEELLSLLISRSPLEIQIHYEKIKPHFVGELETVQVEIVECISESIQDRVTDEMTNTDFFSVQIDDITAITRRSQCSIIARLINSAGEMIERFLGLYDVSPDRTPDTVLNLLDTVLGPFRYNSKLVGLCYDGATLTCDQLNVLQKKVKDAAPQASLVHSLAHRLDFVLQQSFNKIQKFRVFFAHISGIPLFFHRSAKQTYVTDTIVGRRIPNVPDTQLSTQPRLLKVIVEDWDGLKTEFEKVLTDPESDQTAIRLSRGFLERMNDFEFAFLATVFNDIFQMMSALSDVLRKQSLDTNACDVQIRNVIRLIEEKKNEEHFCRMFDLIKDRMDLSGRKFFNSVQDETFIECKRLYFDIINSILIQINTRFRDMNKLIFVSLADTSKFNTYSSTFPVIALTSLHERYPSYFKKIQRLRCELELIYTNEEYQNISLYQLIQLLCEGGLHKDVFQEAYKLFSLVLTLPSTSAAPDLSSSCLNRMKTCLRSSVAQHRSSSFANISIQKEILSDMTGLPFYEEIVDKFAALKKRGIELIYKNREPLHEPCYSSDVNVQPGPSSKLFPQASLSSCVSQPGPSGLQTPPEPSHLAKHCSPHPQTVVDSLPYRPTPHSGSRLELGVKADQGASTSTTEEVTPGTSGVHGAEEPVPTRVIQPPPKVKKFQDRECSFEPPVPSRPLPTANISPLAVQPTRLREEARKKPAPPRYEDVSLIIPKLKRKVANKCRLCMVESTKPMLHLFKTITTPSITHKIYDLTGLLIVEEDALPDHVCQPCNRNIVNLYEFKKMILASDAKYRQKRKQRKKKQKHQTQIKDTPPSDDDSTSEVDVELVRPHTNASEFKVEIEEHSIYDSVALDSHHTTIYEYQDARRSPEAMLESSTAEETAPPQFVNVKEEPEEHESEIENVWNPSYSSDLVQTSSNVSHTLRLQSEECRKEEEGDPLCITNSLAVPVLSVSVPTVPVINPPTLSIDSSYLLAMQPTAVAMQGQAQYVLSIKTPQMVNTSDSFQVGLSASNSVPSVSQFAKFPISSNVMPQNDTKLARKRHDDSLEDCASKKIKHMEESDS